MPAALGPTDLVLSGGGVLGIEHVGAAAVLEEHGAEFKRIAGTSAGAIVGALLAAGATPAQLHELLMTLDYEKFLTRTNSTRSLWSGRRCPWCSRTDTRRAPICTT
jgi:predicted acylesterase/phospholipase RssA